MSIIILIPDYIYRAKKVSSVIDVLLQKNIKDLIICLIVIIIVIFIL